MPAHTAPAVWRETEQIPEVLAATLDAADGFAEVLALLRRDATRRVLLCGNGASSYAGHAVALAALAGPRPAAEIVPVPAGLLATGDVRLREGDVLVAFSASGELRDLADVLDALPAGVATAAITGSPGSTIGQAADARALVAPGAQNAVTHTHAYCGAVLTGLWLLAELTDDAGLRTAVAGAPQAAAEAVADAAGWPGDALAAGSTPAAVYAYGSGAGWAAALETALVVKEICQIPSEGVETREAATTAMTTLLPEHLVVSLATADDAVAADSERVCASRGATVLRAPGAARADRRLAPVTTFPASVALAVELAARAGRDPDQPAWIDTYYETARRGG